MMFEKQQKSGLNMVNPSSSNMDKPEAILNSPAKSEPGTLHPEHQLAVDVPDNAIPEAEGSSANIKDKQKESEVEISKDLMSTVVDDSTEQPAKRLKVNE